MLPSFDTFLWIEMIAVFKRVGKLPVVNERASKLAIWSKILFLSSFNTVIGIIYRAVPLFLSSDERISLILSFSVCGREKRK